MSLERQLVETGVFAYDTIAVGGEQSLAADVSDLCSKHVNRVIRLSAGSAETEASAAVVLVRPNVSQLEAVLAAAKPFCRIVVLGPVSNGVSDVNFYQTVHFKNLEMTLIESAVSSFAGSDG